MIQIQGVGPIDTTKPIPSKQDKPESTTPGILKLNNQTQSNLSTVHSARLALIWTVADWT